MVVYLTHTHTHTEQHHSFPLTNSRATMASVFTVTEGHEVMEGPGRDLKVTEQFSPGFEVVCVCCPCLSSAGAEVHVT